MRGAVFYKLTGSGNDFVFVDGRAIPVGIWDEATISAICARGTGVGADGFAVLEPGSGPTRVRFHFFNADGGRAPMCGNGALCASRMAAMLELAPADGLELETDVGVYPARWDKSGGRSTILLPDISLISDPDIDLGPREQSAHFIDMGVRHLVLVVDDIQAVPLEERGRALRSHPLFDPEGTNVNFVSVTSTGSWSMRTYERGVEAETLACGTGAVACATVLLRAGRIDAPWCVRTASGCELSVTGTYDPMSGSLKSPSLTGEARLVFKAVLV